VKFIGIIPARYASSRFPGKPLADLGGKPMIQRVYEQASKALDNVIVATDDERIYQCVKAFGGHVVMTSSHHACGTDRVQEAYTIARQTADWVDDQTVVVNIQGDEPFIQPSQITALMDCFADADTEIATLVHPFTPQNTWDDLANPNYVKVVVAAEQNTSFLGKAVYFSRSVVPYLRGVEQSEWLHKGQFYRHIGMYAYRADVLQRITQLRQTPLELAECLEQLRWLEHGLTIKVAECHTVSIGIDTPQDLEKAIEYLQKEQ
jgi:3-deoxy-manno-octulosonate cytidylyltransferase (CMP-KDO synthetase)